MKANNIYHQFCELKSANKKAFAVLVDPDKIDTIKAKEIAIVCNQASVDLFFLEEV